MLISLFIAYRDALEALIVLVPLLAYVFSSNKFFLSKYIYAGASIGLLVSIMEGTAVFHLAKALNESSLRTFEGSMMLFVSGLILYFIVTVEGFSKTKPENTKKDHALNLEGYPLFIIALLTVLKEGLDVVVYTFTNISQQATSVALGTLLGIVLAFLSVYILYKTSIKLNIKIIFKLMNFCMIFIGAEMFSEGLAELIPSSGDSLAIAFYLIYVIPSLYFFLKGNLRTYLKKL